MWYLKMGYLENIILKIEIFYRINLKKKFQLVVQFILMWTFRKKTLVEMKIFFSRWLNFLDEYKWKAPKQVFRYHNTFVLIE